MAKRLPQVRDLIEQLGDAQSIADELNKLLPASERRVLRDAVYQWKHSNKIPYHRRPFVAQLAISRGLTVPRDLEPFTHKAPEVEQRSAAE